MAPRSTRANTAVHTNSKATGTKGATRHRHPETKRRNTRKTSSELDEDTGREESDSSNVYQEEHEGSEDDASLHSDALDDDEGTKIVPKRGQKRKVASRSPVKSAATASPKKASPKKRRKKTEDSNDEDDDLLLEDGQEIVGVVVKAPTTGRGTSTSSSVKKAAFTLVSRSSTGADISEHPQLPLAAPEARMQ